MTLEPIISDDRESWLDENRLVASVVAFVGAIGVVVGFSDDQFGAEATIALIMLVLGLVGVAWPRR